MPKGLTRSTASMRAEIAAVTRSADYSERKVQIVASRGSVLGNTTNATVKTDGTKTRLESRMKLFFGPQRVRDIQFLMGGFSATGVGPEVLIDNNVTIDMAFEAADASAHAPVRWGGEPTLLLKPGALTLSQPLPLDLDAKATAWLRTGGLVSNGQFIPISSFFAISGEAMYYSTEATSQVMATGAMAARTTGSTGTGGVTPLAILGIPETPFASVILHGDSIEAGTIGDTTDTTTGARGLFQRGCILDNGVIVPWVNLSRASETGAQNTGFNSVNRRSVYDYGSHFITDYGTNDIVGGANLATLQATATAIWKAARSRGLKVYQSAILPRTNAGNTTPASGFAVGGVRDQFNAWAKTQVGILIDGFIDLNLLAEGTPGLWANGAWTSDGVHPNNAGCVALAPMVKAYTSTF